MFIPLITETSCENRMVILYIYILFLITVCADYLHWFQENYLESAAKYVQISELSKRVAEWEEKIIPRLQEEV